MHVVRNLAGSRVVGLILLALLVVPVAGLPAAPAAAATQVPGNWEKGFVMIGYAANPYNPANVPAALAKLHDTGANIVALAPIWFMTDPNATTMAPVPARGTPSDDSLVAAIQEAHRQGLRVMLRPYIDLVDGSWRAQITPSNPSAWFANYQAFLDHYLDIANSQGVEEFTVGVELISMTQPQYANQWRALIAHVRSRYNGTLTYSANWGKHTDNEYKQITWWDALDYIGLSAYFPLSLNNVPSADALVQGWTHYTDQVGQTYDWVSEIKATADQYHKPVVFTEIGFGSYANSPARWDETAETNQLSLATQEHAVAATLQVWSQQPWFHGVFWWHWEPYVGAGGAQDPTDTLNNKPAVATITQWFGGAAPPPTAAPTPPAGPTPPPATPPPGPPQQPPSQPVPPGPVHPAPAPGSAGVNNAAFAAMPSPGPDTDSQVYFPQTGHILRAEFLAYWRSHGGLAQFGYPISEAYQETNPTDGKVYIVQYFERQRFEYHPELPPAFHVELGLLGVALVHGQSSGPYATVPSPGPDTADRVYFSQTGHTLSGAFLTYWRGHGGLPMFGYPLSEPFSEVSSTDHKTYTVQYFERARFELHPENNPPFNVLLGFLGHWYAGK